MEAGRVFQFDAPIAPLLWLAIDDGSGDEYFVDDLEYIEGLLIRVYNSKDSKRLMKKKAAEEKYHAVKQDSKGNSYWQIESEKDIFKNIKNAKKLKEAAYNYILHGDKGNKVNGLIDGQNLEFIRVSANEYVYGKQSQKLEGKTYKQKMRISPSIIDLIENADIKYDAPDHKNHKLFPNGFKNYQGRVGIDDTIFRYIVRVGKAKSGMIFYDINLEVDVEVPSAKSTSLLKKSTSNTNIPNSTKNVKSEISNDNNKDISSGQYSLGSPMQQMRYNAEAYAKHINRKYQSKADKDSVAKKIKQIVAQDNKSQKAQEETRQKVYDRKGNLVGELTLKERLINEVAVEIAESIEAPRTAEADEVLSALKERPLVINEKQEAEIKHQFGTLTNFRKDTGIRLVSENSEVAKGLTTLETAWNGDWLGVYNLIKENVFLSKDRDVFSLHQKHTASFRYGSGRCFCCVTNTTSGAGSSKKL